MAIKPFLAELKRVKAQDQQPTLTPKILSVNRRAGILHVINITITILYPTLMSYYAIFHPFLATMVLFVAVMLFLKLVSYFLVNRDLRLNQISSQDKNLESSYTVAYPNNITFGDILYF